MNTYPRRHQRYSEGRLAVSVNIWTNWLTSVTAATGNASLTYDAASRLSTVTKGSISSEFIYDGANMIAEYNASNNVIKARYVRP